MDLPALADALLAPALQDYEEDGFLVSLPDYGECYLHRR